ncbi:hypothetical protein [Acidianus sp. HS-5]|uniref:hypothetical protein n=1 Tax=Acidianus sp. HS-5 TaxID=2886040 RepID=UPI001F1B844E|nr:hypothetical protein [Acidianus sp. HS-5]BDC17908.1 hypothetical protein HS5_07980 [Acidianus sp. HS-5]
MNFLFVAIAGIMVAVIVFLLYESEEVKTKLGFSLVIFGFIMMITMFIGATLYLISPTSLSLAEAVLINNFTMLAYILSVFPFLRGFKVKFSLSSLSSILVSLLAVINEILMSLTFNIACRFPNVIYETFNGGWFFYPMMAEMLSLFLIHYVKGQFYKDLFPLIGITSFPPTLLDNEKWFYTALVISLILSFIGIRESKLLVRIVYIALAVSLVSLFLLTPFYDSVIVLSMITYYYTILHVREHQVR